MDPRQAPDVNLFCFIYLFYFINHVLIRVVSRQGGKARLVRDEFLIQPFTLTTSFYWINLHPVKL